MWLDGAAEPAERVGAVLNWVTGLACDRSKDTRVTNTPQFTAFAVLQCFNGIHQTSNVEALLVGGFANVATAFDKLAGPARRQVAVVVTQPE